MLGLVQYSSGSARTDLDQGKSGGVLAHFDEHDHNILLCWNRNEDYIKKRDLLTPQSWNKVYLSAIGLA